jgi:hypothetical protein
MIINVSRFLALSLVLAGVPAVASPGTHPRPRFTQYCSGKGSGAFIGGSGADNVAASSSSAVVAGQQNQSCDAEDTIVGGDANTIYFANYPYATASVIGAGNGNTVASSAEFIGGGIGNLAESDESSAGTGGAFAGAGQSNQALYPYAFEGAGKFNYSQEPFAFSGAGESNSAAAQSSFVGAGSYNETSGLDATIDGGLENTAKNQYASVTGGGGNVASGNASVIPGGYHNLASGQFSFAAGIGSYANTTGSFVWSDNSSGAKHLAPARANEFIARAGGGVAFVTNAAETTGAVLAPGSGTWASASDRNLKRDVTPVSDAAILAKVSALPITEWSYTSERGVRHIGPMAQDFYAAFGIGEDDRHITAVDEDGVALAAIKALNANVETNDGALDALHTRVSAHASELRELRAELHALESKLRP